MIGLMMRTTLVVGAAAYAAGVMHSSWRHCCLRRRRQTQTDAQAEYCHLSSRTHFTYHEPWP